MSHNKNHTLEILYRKSHRKNHTTEDILRESSNRKHTKKNIQQIILRILLGSSHRQRNENRK